MALVQGSEASGQSALGKLGSVAEFEAAARKLLTQKQADYVFGSTETGETYRRNLSSFSSYLLRRRVLQGIEEARMDMSYFGGRITSDLPFFPGPINVAPLYPGALLDIVSLSKSYRIPIFLSDIPIAEPLDFTKLPSIAGPGSSLVWQAYIFNQNYDDVVKRASQCERWGYKGITITVDTELNVKLGNEIPPETGIHFFSKVRSSDIWKIRKATTLPLIVKGVMHPDDAVLAVEAGADGIVVSNHGGRTLDCGEGTLEVLPDIVKRLRSKKSTRRTEVFLDSGVRRGTDVLKALALGARACLLGRAMFYGLAVGRSEGAAAVMRIVREELWRAALLCGVSDLSKVDKAILRQA